MFTPSIFIALFIKRTCELDANVNTDLERVGRGILAYIVQLFVFFHSLSVHLIVILVTTWGLYVFYGLFGF